VTTTAHAWSDEQRLPMDEVESGLARVLRAEGVPPEDATITAAHLVEGTARGYIHHGVERIFEILDGFRHETLVPVARPRRLRDAPAVAILDADRGLGAPLAAQAIGLAVDKAGHVGIAAVGVVNAGHLGILAPWAERAAAAGQLGIVMTTTSPAVVVPGGRTAVLGTNPIAYAFPVGETVVTADFSTAAITRGILLDHRDRAAPLPPGLAVDEEGLPTTDAQAALGGGLLPLGGTLKGGLLSLLVSVLAGPLIGAVANHHITGTRWMNSPPNKGDIFIAIDLAQLTDASAFASELESFFDRIRDDVPGFYPPGEGSRARREDSLRNGIPVTERLDTLLRAQAERRLESQ
jgi:L-2-hydroxycarboxylate dehydrogenase (NAD+)